MKKIATLLSLLLFLGFSTNSFGRNSEDSDEPTDTAPKTFKLLSPKSGGKNRWIAEDFSGKMSATLAGRDTMEIIAPLGLTLWYDKKLKGSYEITYKVQMVMEGNECDRLSDLNCFWAAIDPKYPKNIYDQASQRNGSFERYNALSLFYVGYGGNHNSTTRFREYHGELYGRSRDEIKPVLKEYTAAPNLLVPNKWITIKIVVTEEETTYSVDGVELFSYPIENVGQGDGYFALRLLKNHTRITNFDIIKLK